MAELLALGITHYPPLSTPDASMAGLLRRMLTNPALPASLRSPEGWPAPMRQEWGDDEGRAAAAIHRRTLVDELRKVREALDAFRPDFVLIWGDDQYENFREDVVPPYCISAYPSFEVGVPPNNVWNEPVDRPRVLPGVPKAAKALAGALITEGFDAAYAYRPLHHPLGHAFTNAISYLDYDRRGFDYPLLPVSINCYGSKVIAQRGGVPRFDSILNAEDLDPPAPTPARLFDLGAATARFLAASPWRVALLASSGWSHAFLTARTHFLHPDTEADRGLFEALLAGRYDAWRDYPARSIEESGQQEVLNWMCLAGALDQLQVRARHTRFIDTWIFNSTKVFLIAPPC